VGQDHTNDQTHNENDEQKDHDCFYSYERGQEEIPNKQAIFLT